MAYACPVCEAPQADGAHLANHLAFTALLHDDEHADWLDGVAADWADRTPEDLADVVIEHAEEIDVDTVTAEAADGSRPTTRTADLPADSEVQRVVEEAIEMIEERYEESEKD